jgi:hypothetical protein
VFEHLRRRAPDDKRPMSEGIQRDPPSVIIRYDDKCAQETGQDMWLVRKSPHCCLYGVGRLRIVASGKRDRRADDRIRDRMRERGHQLVAEVAFVKVGDIGSALGAPTRVVGNDSPACGTERRHGGLQADSCRWVLSRCLSPEDEYLAHGVRCAPELDSRRWWPLHAEPRDHARHDEHRARDGKHSEQAHVHSPKKQKTPAGAFLQESLVSSRETVHGGLHRPLFTHATPATVLGRRERTTALDTTAIRSAPGPADFLNVP